MASKQTLRAKALEIAVLALGTLSPEDEHQLVQYTMEKYKPLAKEIEKLIKEADPGQT